jgi:hypothetical protein
MLSQMRTTLRIDDELMLAVKRMAAESGRTLTDAISDLLRAGLARQMEIQSRPRVELPVFEGGTGPAPGVDLDRTCDLLVRMDEAGWRAPDGRECPRLRLPHRHA